MLVLVRVQAQELALEPELAPALELESALELRLRLLLELLRWSHRCRC